MYAMVSCGRGQAEAAGAGQLSLSGADRVARQVCRCAGVQVCRCTGVQVYSGLRSVRLSMNSGRPCPAVAAPVPALRVLSEREEYSERKARKVF